VHESIRLEMVGFGRRKARVQEMFLAVEICESGCCRGCVSSILVLSRISLYPSVWGDALLISTSHIYMLIRLRSLKQAAADPSSLTQEKIIDNLNDAERGRLSKIRNIGIAVCMRGPGESAILNVYTGAYRQWQDDGYGASSFLYRSNQRHP
jgi:hypothetical protein